jgi:hypothetical protein
VGSKADVLLILELQVARIVKSDIWRKGWSTKVVQVPVMVNHKFPKVVT